jgi:predicted Mrr-cat superfamily restriction endonuclease
VPNATLYHFGVQIVQEFLKHYDDMPNDTKDAIPLKQIWVLDRSE